MRTLNWRTLAALLLTPWVLLMVHAQEELPSTATGDVGRFSIPERNKDGRLLWLLSGDRGKRLPDDKMEIEQMVISFYRQTNVDWTLSTPKCILNRQTREAISESPVRITSEKLEITGDGFHWLATNSWFIIRNKVKVVLWGGVSK
jgi:hypothetical protein